MTLTLEQGAVFAGRYRIERCIAMGGMGAVYEATHLETERRRALKVMLPQVFNSSQSDEFRERFKREARIAAQIDSEFIVDVFDAGVDEKTGVPFLVMELLRGEELGKRLERVGRMTPLEVTSYLYQTALALDKTHKASIIHRDLKPENLFLTEREHGEPRIKVLDFGIAKFVADHGTQGHASTTLGTPLYMAPEQFMGLAASPSMDIYALGMIAFTLLTGESYWERDLAELGNNLYAFVAKATTGPQETATARAASRGVTLPPTFDPWFQKATAADPSQRFASATESIAALADALGVAGAIARNGWASSSQAGAYSTLALSPTRLTPFVEGNSAIRTFNMAAATRKKAIRRIALLVLGALAALTAILAAALLLRAPQPAAGVPLSSASVDLAASAKLFPAAPSAAGQSVTVGPVASAALASAPPEPAAASAAPASPSASVTTPHRPTPSASGASGSPRKPAGSSKTEPLYIRD